MSDQDYENTIAYLDERIAKLEAENAKLTEKYNDLIYQVVNAYPNETRHETAKRYIYNAEHQDNPPTSALLGGEE